MHCWWWKRSVIVADLDLASKSNQKTDMALCHWWHQDECKFQLSLRLTGVEHQLEPLDHVNMKYEIWVGFWVDRYCVAQAGTAQACNMGTDTWVSIIIHSAAKSIISQSNQTSHGDPAHSLFHTAVCANIWALMDCHDSCLPRHSHTLASLLLIQSIDLIAFVICAFVSSNYLHMLSKSHVTTKLWKLFDMVIITGPHMPWGAKHTFPVSSKVPSAHTHHYVYETESIHLDFPSAKDCQLKSFGLWVKAILEAKMYY